MAPDLFEGIDPVLGGGAALLGLFARVVAFPLARLRRRVMTDGPDDEPSGIPFIPKPVQNAFAMGLTVLAGVAAGVSMGKPPIIAATTALSAAALSMVAYDVQTKRAPHPAPSEPKA